VLAVGEYALGHVSAQMIKMSTGLGGDISGTHEDTCGALTAGVVLIGARYGRSNVSESDQPCYGVAARYRERFIREFGAGRCGDLRRPRRYGPRGEEPSSVLVARAAHVLLSIFEEYEEKTDWGEHAEEKV
jgi:C_GCAxxG_C_C family probable redox protein